MPAFTNFATLSYNGGTTNSNIVTGEFLEILTASKTAVVNTYSAGDSVDFVLSLVNSGTTQLTDITVTDDLGGYLLDENTTVYPLDYREGSARLYINGVLQPAPALTEGPPLVFTGITIPAGGNAILIYEAAITGFAPLSDGGEITNTADITGGGLAAPLSANATITPESRANLTVSKAVCPPTVSENGTLTYTFVIQNSGNTDAVTTDNVVLTDTFDPILDPITVTYNSAIWTEGTQYTYDETTGLFSTIPGQITVPAATYVQNEDGVYVTSPGTATIVITGTV
ncbi:MAG: hypothetical protein IJC48_03000 [Clostridia bacterium]|nr:hypothetical protein [Clostridia bacterium]